MLPIIKVTNAHEPDLSISPLGRFSAYSRNSFSAASNPLRIASLGLQGKEGSLITYNINSIISYTLHIDEGCHEESLHRLHHHDHHTPQRRNILAILRSYDLLAS